MNWSKPDLSRRSVLAIVLVVLVVSGGAVGVTYLFTGGSGTAYETGSGLVVTTNTDHGVESSNPFTGTDSVTINNATFTASGSASLTVDRFTGTWTNVSSVDASSNDITIDPGDKPQATLGGSVTALSFRDQMSLSDDNVAFVYSASGSGTVTVNGLAANTDWTAATAGGTQLDSGTTDSSGSATVSVSSGTDQQVILFTNTAPTYDNSTASPAGGTGVTDRSVTLQINVSDAEFSETQGDTVTGDFQLKKPSESSFSSVGTDSRSSNGTISVGITADEGGTYEWKVDLSDNYGGTNTTNTYTFDAPSTLTIREEMSPHSKITGADVTVKFFEDVEDDPTIIERSDDDGDGEIDLSGLPSGTQFVVSADAPGYHNRTIIVDDIYSQQSVFLLNDSEPSIENQFVVEDRTGNFPTEDTEIVIQKAINRSKYDGTNTDTFNWTNIAGDDLGADEAFVTDLREGHRYRIRVQNSEGDMRILGAYTAEVGGTVTLNIGNVVVDPQDSNEPAYEANRLNESGSPVQVKFEYNDSTDNTQDIYLEIYEYNNESNVLLSNTTFTGPYGTFSNLEDVPASENETTWVVEFTAVRDGADNVSGRLIVGPQRDILGSLSPWVVTLFFVGIIWTTAGLFSQINGSVGGVVVAAEGAIFWFVGFVPTGLGSGVIVLALVTAAILFVRERRAGGL